MNKTDNAKEYLEKRKERTKIKEKLRLTELILDNYSDNFHKVVDYILGEYYYNMGMDIYSCNNQSRKDICNEIDKLRTIKNIAIIEGMIIFIIIMILIGVVIL